MSKLTSEGTCLFCNKTFKKAGITRHLNTHLSKKVDTADTGHSFHLKIEQNPGWDATPHFLNLWVDGDAKLKDIDSYLRKIWLECCGHLSAFRARDLRSEIGMSKKAGELFTATTQFEYEYDFGSTTELLISVAGVFPIKADEKIVLLSRNEPLAIMCDHCGIKPAEQLCEVCAYDEDESTFCESCAPLHAETCSDFGDYAAQPIVNSPRMGVCAYDGGTIDKGRDGIYSLK